MPRRSDHTRDELHELVLGAARAIAAKEGAAGLTARRIAGEIGYSQGTLYNLFRDLDDIVQHLNAETLDDIHASLSRVAVTGDPEAVLKRLAAAYIQFTRKHQRRWGMLFEDIPRASPRPDWYRGKIDKLFDLVESALAPLFAPDEAAARRMAARVLWSGVHGICSLANAGAVISASDVRRMADLLVAHYVAGLKTRRR